MRRDNIVLGIGVAMFVGAISLPACGTGAAACKVVDVAANACTVVRYLAPDGTAEDLTTEDLADLASAKKQARAKALQEVPDAAR